MNDDMVIIDTRQPEEYERGHVDGAINISPDKFIANDLPVEISSIPKDTPLILYCISGQRSNTCISILRSKGFTNLTNGVNKIRVQHMIDSEGIS